MQGHFWRLFPIQFSMLFHRVFSAFLSMVAFLTIFLLAKNLQQPIRIFEIGDYWSCHGEQNASYHIKEDKNLYEKMVSKLTLHFLWGHLSRKQTVSPFLCSRCMGISALYAHNWVLILRVQTIRYQNAWKCFLDIKMVSLLLWVEMNEIKRHRHKDTVWYLKDTYSQLTQEWDGCKIRIEMKSSKKIVGNDYILNFYIQKQRYENMKRRENMS